MGDAPQRGLDAADDDGHAGERLPAEVAVDERGAVGPEAGVAAGGVLVLAAHLLLGGELVEHRVEVARRDAHHQPRRAHAEQVGRVAPARLGDHPDPEAAALEEAADDRAAEGGVIDVGVAVDDEHVELVPASRGHLLAGGGEEAAEIPGGSDGVLAELDEGHGPPRLVHRPREA